MAAAGAPSFAPPWRHDEIGLVLDADVDAALDTDADMAADVDAAVDSGVTRAVDAVDARRAP